MPSYYPRPPQVGAGDDDADHSDDDGYDDGNVDLKLDNDENVYLSDSCHDEDDVFQSYIGKSTRKMVMKAKVFLISD